MNKDEEKFLEENKSWILLIILAALISKIEYLNLFKNIIINGIINIIFGIITVLFVCAFFKESIEWIKNNSKIYRLVIYIFLTIGIVNSFYHIGYAIGQIIAVI